METLPITLIVKAPNQQIEDQTVQCELSWTIQKLKQHLSEVYPSKPPKHEQKLIYSGQLLSDTVTLKDILRHYDGQEAHTVHLVCSTKYSKGPQEKTPSPASSPTSTPINIQNTTNTSQNQEPTQTTTEQPSFTNSVPNLQPNVSWVNMNGPQMMPGDVNQYAMQLAWMQQAYFQYMTQYMQLAANSYNANPIQPMPNPNDAGGAVPAQPQPNPAEQPPPPEAAAVPRDPDNPERDWLDVFYMLSRAMVLFSVVYFYSSPIRFIFVLLLGIGLYLYQIGFFRNINNNNNNNNGPQDPPVPDEEQAPSRLMVVWTFFATFFASLIPEIPNAV